MPFLLLAVLVGSVRPLIAQGDGLAGPGGWKDSFEKTKVGAFPAGWVKDANAKDGRRNLVQGIQRVDGRKALQLHGIVGGCWGALAYRTLTVKAPFEVSLWVRNGEGKLSGCHPHRAGFGLRTGPSWRSHSRSLVQFDGKGRILGSAGAQIASYRAGQWYHLSVRYRIDGPLGGRQVILEYRVDGKKVATLKSKGIKLESRLSHLELSAQEGSAWFDGVEVRPLREQGSALAEAACMLIPPPSDYAIVVSKDTYRAWRKSVTALQKKRRATILVYSKELSDVRKQLAELSPKYACFVATPEEAGRDFVVQVHRLTRALDDDPYGDCIWGILTGYKESDLLRIISEEKPLRIRKGAAGCALPLEHFAEGQWWSEIAQHTTWRKELGGSIQKEESAADTTTAIVAALSGPFEFFLTSGHATERGWQMGYSFKNGQLLCEKGSLYGLDLKGKRHPVSAKGPRIYSAAGNCLMGWIADRESMALAWMHSGGVRQMSGYVVSTWYGYGGWGVNEYFYLGRHDFAESFFLNNQALLARLETNYPRAAKLNIDYDGIQRSHDLVRNLIQKHKFKDRDAAGLLWDRDTVAFYGDPAWVARLDRQDPVPYEQSLKEQDGIFTFEVRVTQDGTWERPPATLLPYRIQPGKLLQGKAILTDNFVLMPLAGPRKKGSVHRLRFRAKRAMQGATRH